MRCPFPYGVPGGLLVFAGTLELLAPSAAIAEQPPNRWVHVRTDAVGARHGSALRYAADAKAFFLWGFMNADYELLQENPTMPVPEYDMVSFAPSNGRWRDYLPMEWETEWEKKLPQTYAPRTYSGITSGSERTLFRPPPGFPKASPRPDLNIVFDQVAYHPPSKRLIYFTGGLTAAFDVQSRRWSDLAPTHSPPPVLAGSLAYDAIHDEMILFSGGNVAERGAGGRIVGYTGTWAYSFRDKDWRRLTSKAQPPPRMNTRLVCDTRNQLLVVFAGDGQSHYLADTWLFDLKNRQWRPSQAGVGPEPRAGHFSVYDPESGWVIIGGGYNRKDLTDMWAYHPAMDRWRRLAGEVPAGFYLSADIAPEQRLILLATSTRRPGDRHGCNVLYPVRTTYAYYLNARTAVIDGEPKRHLPLAKRPTTDGSRRTDWQSVPQPSTAEADLRKARANRLRDLPVNRWVALSEPGRVAPTRTWGSATFDSDRGRILYWGGGHCGYGGNDVDAYDVAGHTWISSSPAPEFPHRLWDHGVNLAGVTFQGSPWTVHGRKIYAYDPTGRRLILVRPIQLTTGYIPEPLRAYPGEPRARADAKAKPPSSYRKFVTWACDPDTGRWTILGPAPVGLDALVTTPRGVMGVNVDWPTRLNDAGYLLSWSPEQPPADIAVFLFEAAKKTWQRLSRKQPSPQNLYELTSLAYDSRRDRLLLHGAGARHDELWAFDVQAREWKHLKPRVAAPAGAPPVCNREAVYLPDQDVMLTYGPGPGKKTGPVLWAYKAGDNAWHQVPVEPPPGIDLRAASGQNRALVYDVRRDLLLLVLGAGGDQGRASVFALRFDHGPR